MSKLQVIDAAGKPAGEVDLADALLVTDRGDQAVHDVVVAHRAAVRRGTASTLGKGAVAGSNRKPWRQKGTGRARAGYRQSPVWRGGGVAHGPKPRDYDKKVNRKVARLAFRRAMGAKVAAGQVKVVETLAVAEPRTRLFTAMLKALGIERPALLVVAERDHALVLASRNVVGVALRRAADVSVYELLRYGQIVVTRPAMDVLRARLGAGEGER